MALPAIVLALAQLVPAILPLLKSRRAQEVGEAITGIAQAVTGQDSPDAALKTLQADPSTMLAYQQAVLNQQTELERIAAGKEVSLHEQDVKETEAFLRDVQDARALEVARMDRTTEIMGYLITVGFFSMVAALIWVDIPTGNREVVYLLAGTVTTAWLSVIAYRFGTSRGSSIKQRFIEREFSRMSGASNGH